MRFKDCNFDFYCHWQAHDTERGQKACSDCVWNRQTETQSLRARLRQADKDMAGMAETIERVSGMSDRWKRAALKRTKKIKMLEAKLGNYRYWQGHAARCSYLYHKSEAKLRRAGRRIKALKDDLAAGTMLDVMLKFLDK